MKCDELKRKYSDITGPYYGYNEVNEAIEELQAENAELKQKLEDVQASAYAESLDVGMENFRLKRALWLARLRALRGFSVLTYFQVLRVKGKESNMDFDEMAYRINLACVKCRAKAEESK